MTSEKHKSKLQWDSSNLSNDYTFNDVVDKACDGLMDCQIKYSIRKIQEMEEYLCNLERELDTFLNLRMET